MTCPTKPTNATTKISGLGVVSLRRLACWSECEIIQCSSGKVCGAKPQFPVFCWPVWCTPACTPRKLTVVRVRIGGACSESFDSAPATSQKPKPVLGKRQPGEGWRFCFQELKNPCVRAISGSDTPGAEPGTAATPGLSLRRKHYRIFWRDFDAEHHVPLR